jgi:hypothetical protein
LLLHGYPQTGRFVLFFLSCMYMYENTDEYLGCGIRSLIDLLRGIQSLFRISGVSSPLSLVFIREYTTEVDLICRIWSI